MVPASACRQRARNDMTTKATIPHTLFAAAACHGNHVAIRDEDGHEIAYDQIEPLVRAAAARLVALGLAAGDHAALWAPNSAGWIIAALAIQAAGAVLVPLNTRLKGREAAHILTVSDARVLLTVPEFLGVRFAELIAPFDLPRLGNVVPLDPRTGVVGGAAVADDAVAARLAALAPADLSDILFSSGTTGAPKGAMTAHGQNVRLYALYADRLALRRGDVNLAVNPFFHSFGYKAGWLVALMRGCTILPHAVFDAAAVLRRIERECVSVLPGPPTLYQSLLAQPLDRVDIASLRLAITGAAKVPVTLIRDMRETLGIDTVLTAYGLTENCGLVTMCRPDDSLETIANTAGGPVHGVAIRLVDDRGELVPTGTPGHLHVSGVGVMQGYVGDPAATARAIDADGWLRTGDVAVADAAGNIAITDRSDDMFTVGGFNAYPAEIEGLMAAHPAILQVAVIGVPDDRLGHVARAFCVLRPGGGASGEQIVAWCRAEMANYKAPRTVEIVDALPLNAAGKVQKFVLRQQVPAGTGDQSGA
jgi:acyl-CoA synthetase (AMP-forming)/AMP-acid ligase II